MKESFTLSTFLKNSDSYKNMGPLERITFKKGTAFPKDQYFLKGGHLMTWYYALMKLPGKALHVALELRFQCDLQRTSQIKFSCSQLVNAGVSRDSALRAINRLEKNGFILTDRKSGRKILVTLIPRTDLKNTPNIT